MYHVVNADSGKVYILDGMYKLQKNFRVKEFACKDKNHVIIISFKAVHNLQKLRDFLKLPLTINSGFRTYMHNKAQKGAKDSRHMHGDGFDIKVPFQMTGAELKKAVIEIFGEDIGLHVYGDDFVHVDFRGYRARW